MANYRVKWEIDLDADSPEEAALQAREYQKDSEGIFEVRTWVEQEDGVITYQNPVMVDMESHEMTQRLLGVLLLP
jgi:hypothetical protein